MTPIHLVLRIKYRSIRCYGVWEMLHFSLSLITDSIKPGLQFSFFILGWFLSRDQLFTRIFIGMSYQEKLKSISVRFVLYNMPGISAWQCWSYCNRFLFSRKTSDCIHPQYAPDLTTCDCVSSFLDWRKHLAGYHYKSRKGFGSAIFQLSVISILDYVRAIKIRLCIFVRNL